MLLRSSYCLLAAVSACYSGFFLHHFFGQFFPAPVAWGLAISLTFPSHFIAAKAIEDLRLRRLSAAAPTFLLLAALGIYADLHGVRQEAHAPVAMLSLRQDQALLDLIDRLKAKRQQLDSYSDWAASARKDWAKREVWLSLQQEIKLLQAEISTRQQQDAKALQQATAEATQRQQDLTGGVAISFLLLLLTAAGLQAYPAPVAKMRSLPPLKPTESAPAPTLADTSAEVGCRQCGQPLPENTRKIFCSKQCKSKYHNSRRK